jgi:monofunctional biosynthetic peptidoglycan transglycosylase
VTDKDSQAENGADAEVRIVTGEPRSAGGPATGGSGADPRTEPPAGHEPDPETTRTETTRTDGPSHEEPSHDERGHEHTASPHSNEPDAAEPADEQDPADAAEPQPEETHSYLPPVFEAPPAREPEIGSPEAPPPREDNPAEPPHAPSAPNPAPSAFTSAAYDLFFPPPSDTPPTYQTRGHAPYGGPSSSGDETEPPAASDRERRKARAIELFWIAARYAGYAAIGYLALVLTLILVFRFVNPPASSLMLRQWLTGNSVSRTWVPINRVSPNLIRAVIVAEDGRFCDHAGIDFQAIGQAIEQATDGVPRGASTISMQVTKNMFLWSSKSYIRKIIELPLTLIMEIVWPKWRILEVYLNIAEWGPGVYGAEAASRFHFRQPAARLSERQAALLAATLPIIRDAGDPSTLVSRKARVIQARMRAAGTGAAACVLSRI